MTKNNDLQMIDGWLAGAKCVPSPNYNERPGDAGVDLVVIHNISLPPNQYGGPHIEALFTNQLDATAHPYFAEIADLEVSAHFLIKRDGNLIQFVSVDDRAWHAGRSVWCERENCNDFSVGIELEGTDVDPYTDQQYEKLKMLVEALWRYYPSLSPDAIVGHCDIAPERKTDPGPAFDWRRLSELLGRDQLGSSAISNEQ